MKTNIDVVEIGKRIRERRRELKISAEELGKRIGKDRSTIFRYEKGEIEKLPLEILEPVAKALDTTPAVLMGWEKIQKNNDILSDIIVRMRTDEDFFALIKMLHGLEKDQVKSVSQMLFAFLK